MSRKDEKAGRGFFAKCWAAWVEADGWLAWCTVIMMVYSLIILLIAWKVDALGSDHRVLIGSREVIFTGYLKKLNWSLFVFFWPLVALVIYLSWKPFERAWRVLAHNKILIDNKGGRAKVRQLHLFLKRMRWWRRIFFVLAPIAALPLIYCSTEELRNLFSDFSETTALSTIYERHCPGWQSDKQSILNAQDCDRDKAGTKHREVSNNTACFHNFDIMYSCHGHFGERDVARKEKESRSTQVAQLPLYPKIDSLLAPDFRFVSWVPLANASDAGDNRMCRSKCRKVLCTACKNCETGTSIIGRDRHITFLVAVYLQEFVIAAMALLGLFQLFFHSFVFVAFEHCRSLNPGCLSIRMNPFSNLREFGLESWNRVISNVYWAFAAGLIIPIVSRKSQTVAKLDTGQIILQALVPVLIVAPMLLTIISRQQRLDQLRPLIEGESDPAKIALYHSQKLWPLDKTWASKLGLVIAFALLWLLLGVKLPGLPS